MRERPAAKDRENISKPCLTILVGFEVLRIKLFYFLSCCPRIIKKNTLLNTSDMDTFEHG